MQSFQLQKKATPCAKKRYRTYRLLSWVHPLAQLTVLRNPQNPMLHNAFQSARHPKVPLPVGASLLHVIHVP